MKTKEIIDALKIQNGIRGKKKKEEFLEIMLNEIQECYNAFGQKDNDRLFDASVKQVRQKWNSINNKIVAIDNGSLTDGLWNFFFATKVTPLKQQLCTTWAAKKAVEHQKYLERKERREENERKRLAQADIVE